MTCFLKEASAGFPAEFNFSKATSLPERLVSRGSGRISTKFKYFSLTTQKDQEHYRRLAALFFDLNVPKSIKFLNFIETGR